MFRYFTIAAAIVGAMISNDQAQQEVYWRLVVIDVSASMKGDSLSEVRKEVSQHLREQPPAPEAPITFLTFSSNPYPAKSFTDLSQAQAFVSSLRSDNGGTSIGKALEAAVVELKHRSEVKSTVLMLFTDDVDSDRSTILQAEADLAKIFHSRIQRGLTQAVLLRRWSSGGRLSTLANGLANHGVTVMESQKPMTLATVAIRPSVKVLSATVTEKGLLQVKFSLEVIARNVPAGYTVPEMQFTCPDAGPGKSESWTITPGDKPQTYETKISLTTSAMTSGKTVFRLLVATIKTHKTMGKQTLPMLPSSEITTSVAFDTSVQYELGAQLKPTGKVRWDTLVATRVIYECELRVGIRTPRKFSLSKPIKIGWKGLNGAVIISGEKSTLFNQPSEKKTKIEIAFPVTDTALRSGRPPTLLQIECKVLDAPKLVTLVPNVLKVSSGKLADFPKATTIVDVKVGTVTPAVWHELPDRAGFSVELNISVNGPLAGTKFFVVGSASYLRLIPDVIVAGTQTLQMHIIAPLHPAPQENSLTFQIKPPAATPSIRVTCTKTIEIKVPGPAPARLVVFDGGAIQVNAWPNSRTADASFTVGLRGAITEKFANQVRVLGNSTTGKIHWPSDAPLFTSTTVRANLTDQSEKSYFLGQTDTLPVTITPTSPTPAIESMTTEVHIYRQAPFTVHLVLALGIGAIIGFCYLTYRTVALLRPSSPPYRRVETFLSH